MTYEQRDRLGRYRGRPYFLSVRVDPDLNDPTEFAVVVHYERSNGERVQIARIDTEHGYTHFDRLYRREQPKDPVDMNIWAAWDHMEENWRTYARSYEREFG
jgi:hypothetical protein